MCVKVKNTFLCITTTVRDVLAAYPNTIILPSSSKYKENSHKVATFDNTGIVLYPKNLRRMIWNLTMTLQNKWKGLKSTIRKGADHNGSTGLYYSFGNKGSYEMVNNSSVEQYATKVVKISKVMQNYKNGVFLQKIW